MLPNRAAGPVQTSVPPTKASGISPVVRRGCSDRYWVESIQMTVDGCVLDVKFARKQYLIRATFRTESETWLAIRRKLRAVQNFPAGHQSQLFSQ